MTERAKVDKLLTKVQKAGHVAAVAQLVRYQLNTSGILFTVVANHLNPKISQTPDYQLSRKINATNTNVSGRGSGGRNGGGRGGRGYQGRGGGRGQDGRGRRGTSEKTTFYSAAGWEKLSDKERDRIRREQDKKGERGTMRNISKMTTKQLTTAIISSIKAATSGDGDSANDDASTPKKVNMQAGFSCGGKAGAKRSKTE